MCRYKWQWQDWLQLVGWLVLIAVGADFAFELDLRAGLLYLSLLAVIAGGLYKL